VTAALQEIPAVNGVIDDSTNEIVYRNYVDVSVAVSAPSGLVVPVLRNTEKMSFAVRSGIIPNQIVQATELVPSEPDSRSH
jgi:pyruvate/2-oxoglutarate dehydrogenase complex dihydrolipoamide acyltransferase (E2) component